MLALSIMVTVCHAHVLHRYEKFCSQVKEANFDDMDIMHHLTSGMKSIFS
jgi:hypothetical protein